MNHAQVHMLVDLPQNGIPLFPTFLKYHIQDQLDYIGEDDIINLTGVNALYFWVYSMLYCVQRILSENIVRIAYSIPCRFPSLKILRFISANTKELWKNYLRLKALILIRNFDAHWNFGILIKNSVQGTTTAESSKKVSQKFQQYYWWIQLHQ